MRRQVKPFVTEYRGTIRRHKDQPGGIDNPADAASTWHRPSPEPQRSSAPPDSPDTSYEAALRAADALFAAPARRTTQPETAPSVPRPAPRAPATGRVLEPVVEAAPSLPADQSCDREGQAGDAAAPPGRILQAIEPQTEDRFAALEAERAPKRRGRKPGSKNKPKPALGDDWAAATSRTSPAAPTRPLFALIDAAPLAATAEDDDPSAEPSLEEDAAMFEDGGGEGPAATARSRPDRFGWKRAGLRPGERWKRRLPKAAW